MTQAEAIKAARQIAQTKHYQALRTFWISRREQLLKTDPKTDAELWQAWGSIRELTLNLQGTDLMVDYLVATPTAEIAANAAINEPMPTWLMQSAGVDLA